MIERRTQQTHTHAQTHTHKHKLCCLREMRAIAKFAYFSVIHNAEEYVLLSLSPSCCISMSSLYSVTADILSPV